MICNGGINPYVQPVSTVIIPVPAGAQVTAEFHHTLAGADPTDPADPIDPSHKGPITAYLCVDSLHLQCNARANPRRLQCSSTKCHPNDGDWPKLVQDLRGRPGLGNMGSRQTYHQQGQGHIHNSKLHCCRPIPTPRGNYWYITLPTLFFIAVGLMKL